jgi:S1-C subfamily serine protease
MTAANLRTALAAACLGLALLLPAWSAERAPVPAERLKLPPDAPVGGTLGQLSALLEGIAPVKGQTLKTAPRSGRPKGFSQELYQQVAPAVVLVRTSDGMGTGFFIHPDGWILTNNHVIREARPDPRTGALQATVFLGELVEGDMQPVPEGIPALVYKTTAVKDLALLKLQKKPARPAKLAVLALADKEPIIGQDCVAIGHPAAGMLWTLRNGIVSQKGTWPREMTDVAASLLGYSGDSPQRRQLQKTLGTLEKRKVLLSSCGLNPGDSGGPLVDREGRVIAVSFAVPKIDTEREVDLGKFSYHIHLDEVKAFLADRDRLPAEPPPEVPDVLPPASRFVLADLDGDGISETLLFGTAAGEAPTGLLLDLKGANGRMPAGSLSDPAKLAGWKFQFALQRLPHATSFYATTGEGPPDLILRDFDGDGKADLVLHRDAKGWRAAPGEGRPLLDPQRFAGEDLQARFRPFVHSFGNLLEKPKK